MINIIEKIKDAFMAYQTNLICLLTYWMSVIYLYNIEKNKIYEKWIRFSIIAFIFIPVTANIFLKFMFYEKDYSKLYYMTGMLIIIAMAIVEINDVQEGRKGNAIILCSLLVGTTILSFDMTTENINLSLKNQKVSQEVREIDEKLQQRNAVNISVLAPREVCAQLREIDVDNRLFYGVDTIDNNLLFPDEEESRNLYEISYYLEENQWDVNAWANYGQMCGIDCVIIRKQYNQEEVIQQYGYFYVGETEEYVIYLK